MRKALRIMAILAAFGLTAWIGVVALAQSSPTQSPATSTTVGTGDEFKGNCDEPEHVNDPECVGATLVPEDNEADDDADDNGVDDNNDQGDDNDDQNDDNDDQNDDSGPSENSGPSDNSGPGGGDQGDND
jgi:hypothetical protein